MDLNPINKTKRSSTTLVSEYLRERREREGGREGGRERQRERHGESERRQGNGVRSEGGREMRGGALQLHTNKKGC